IVLAVAGATQAQEEKLAGKGKGVEVIELALGETAVGEVRYLGDAAASDLVEVMSALAALEVERARSEEWGNEGAVSEFMRDLLDGSLTAIDDVLARAGEVGSDLSRGGGVLMVRAHA